MADRRAGGPGDPRQEARALAEEARALLIAIGHKHARGEFFRISQRHCLLDRGSGQSMYTGESGSVSHAGCAGDLWVHPRALAELPDMDQGAPSPC